MPFRHVAHRRGEEVDVALDLVRDLGAGEHGHPRGRELDAERHAVDEPADAERLRVPGVVEGEARHDLRGPLDEQAHRRGAAVPVLRETEALDVEHPLALDVEPLPRRRQELDVRGALDHLAQKPGALDEMLEVVEHEQRRALAEVVQQLLLRREAAVRAVDGELDRLGEGGREEVRRGDGGERDEVDAVRVAVDAASGGLEGEPGLARPARPDEREQAAVRVLQQPVDRFELRRPADERRSWQREVLHAGLDRLQQREVARQPVDLELVDALRRAQILEAVRAEVADVSRRRAHGSSATAAPARRGRRRRSARPCARRGRRIPPRSAAARPCAAPCARGSARPPSARWASAAAATASDARAKATKNASPCVSTSTPSCSANAARSRRRCSCSASP